MTDSAGSAYVIASYIRTINPAGKPITSKANSPDVGIFQVSSLGRATWVTSLGGPRNDRAFGTISGSRLLVLGSFEGKSTHVGPVSLTASDGRKL